MEQARLARIEKFVAIGTIKLDLIAVFEYVAGRVNYLLEEVAI